MADGGKSAEKASGVKRAESGEGDEREWGLRRKSARRGSRGRERTGEMEGGRQRKWNEVRIVAWGGEGVF